MLLDEYQDTSVAQARLLARLFSGADAESGRGHPVTAVGDPCQAIYGWRGASVGQHPRASRDDFPPADGDERRRRTPLSVNRRSDARILEVANALAAPLLRASLGGAAAEAGRTPADGTVRALGAPTTYAGRAGLAGRAEVPR